MALNGLICADVPLSNYSLTHTPGKAYPVLRGMTSSSPTRTTVLPGVTWNVSC